MDDEQRLFWRETTGPFARVGGDRPAEIHLRQVSDNAFALERSFDLIDEGGTLLVDQKRLKRSNLASIPTWLGWFMRRHGRHTPAALMHDQEVGEAEDIAVPYESRVIADRRFREALRASGVPPVRAALMWTAVTLATRRSDPGRFVLLLAWMVTAISGMAVLGWGFAQWNWWMIIGALVAPLLASIFWEDQWHAGIIAGYALPIVILGSIPGIVAYHVYWLVERGTALFTGDRPPTFNQR